MHAVTWQTLRDDVLTLAGVVPEQAQTEEVRALDRMLGRALDKCWRHYPWPDLVRVEQRTWRNAWDTSVTYATGAEVWHSSTYWRAAGTITSGQPAPGSNASWVAVGSDFETWLPLEPADFDPIGTPLGLYWDDPRRSPRALRIEFRLSSRGLEATGDSLPLRPWLEHKLRSWRPGTETYSASATYAVGAVRYYDNDWWQCEEATSAGQSPDTHPAKWLRLEVPAHLQRAIVRGAYADLLRTERQMDKAAMEEAAADVELHQAIDAALTAAGQMGRYRRLY